MSAMDDKTVGRRGDVLARGSDGRYGPRSLTGLLAFVALTVKDSLFRIVGSGDSSKQLAFEVDGLTTATTRTWTVPDANIVVAGSASALTSGVIPRVVTGGLLGDSQLSISGSALTLTSASGAATIDIDGPAGFVRALDFDSAGSLRWRLSASSTAESGSDAGSLFNITAYTDAGSSIDSPISITRAAGGNITLVRPLTTSGNITQTGATTGSTGTGTWSANGDILVEASKRIGIVGLSSTALFNIGAGQSALSGVSQYGFRSAHAGTSAATTRICAFRGEATTTAASFTCAQLMQFDAASTVSAGAGSTVTRYATFHSRTQTIGGTSNVGWEHGNGTLAATGTWCLYNNSNDPNYLGTGQTSSGDTTDATSTTTGSLTTLGGMSFGVTKSIFGGGYFSTSPTIGIGYGTGAGGTVTQVTSRTTGVTLNKVCGQITLVSAAGSATYQSFTVTNSTVADTDVPDVVQKSGTDLYEIHVTNVAGGTFQITFRTTGGTTTEQPVFNFFIKKAVAA